VSGIMIGQWAGVPVSAPLVAASTRRVVASAATAMQIRFV
jgi:hypothetical protein